MSTVQSHLASIMDGLAKTAVEEIMKLFDNSFAVFSTELCQKQNEIEVLKRHLELVGGLSTAQSTAKITVFSCSFCGESFNGFSSLKSHEQNHASENSECRNVTPANLSTESLEESHNVNKGDDLNSDARHGFQFHQVEEICLTQVMQRGESNADLTHTEDPAELGEKHRAGHSHEEEFSGLEFEVKAEQEEEHVAQRLNQTGSEYGTGEQNHLDSGSISGGVDERTTQLWFVPLGETLQYSVIDPNGQTLKPEAKEELEKQPRRKPRRKLWRGQNGSGEQKKCKQCQKKFAYINDLKKHQMIHNGRKLLSCDTCGRTCLFPSQMINHERIHTGEKPFGCGVCGKHFLSVSSLNIHQWSHVRSTKPDGCELCGVDSGGSSDSSRRRGRSLRPCSKCRETNSKQALVT